jgi:hypothetical protein
MLSKNYYLNLNTNGDNFKCMIEISDLENQNIVNDIIAQLDSTVEYLNTGPQLK